jgi:hypothetical protein
VALAVGLTPEFLPMISVVTLFRGAAHMARQKVIVKHLEAVLRVYVHHHNAERPHRGLRLSPPEGPREPIASAVRATVCRRDLLGGLLHEYYQAAA